MNRKVVSEITVTLLLLSMFSSVFKLSIVTTSSGSEISEKPSPTYRSSSTSYEPPPTEWNKTYGGTSYDEARSVVQTSDGGYALAGLTESYGAGYWDFWLVKTDASGNAQWNITYGGTSYDEARSVVQTSDGGYALAGYTDSYGAGLGDFWLIKTDSNGNPQWNKTYGETGDDQAYSMVQTSDGGFALEGATNSYGNYADSWLVRTDANGNLLWNKTYGGIGAWTQSVVQTSDGGYALAGLTDSYGAGAPDFLLVKIDANGVAQWNKTYGGANSEYLNSVVQSRDGGYALAGTVGSYGVGVYSWLVKTDADGNAQWNKTYGETGDDRAYSLIQTSDGGYALAGYTDSSGGGDFDFWLVKTDANGVVEWNKKCGRTVEEARSLVQTSDGGYALAGSTYSYDAYSDFWLVKVAPERPAPDFSITASSSSLTIRQGSSDVSAITITSVNSFSQPVQLTVSGVPSGVTATLNPQQVTPPADGSAASTLTVSVETTATPASYTLTVTGISGALTHSTQISLEITAAPQNEWTFAIITDLHIGRGYDNYNGEDYYLTVRLNNTVERIKELALINNIRFVVVLGDLTENGKRSEILKAQGILDSLTRSNIPYFPVLGNHDVDSEKGEGEFCSIFNANFFEDQCRALGADWQDNRTLLPGSDFGNLIYLQNYAFKFKGENFVFLDFVDRHLGHIGVSLYSQSMTWLKTQLEVGMPTFLFSHIPMIKDTFSGFYSIDEIGNIIHNATVEHEMRIFNFAGHIHGSYDESKYFRPRSYDSISDFINGGARTLLFSPNFVNANNDYKEEDFLTPADIPVVTTEAMMVASNEQVSKGVIRIVKMSGEGIDYSTVKGEFWALNPYLKMETERVNKLKVDFEAYAFTTRFTSDQHLRYILDYGDGSLPEVKGSAENKQVEFSHTYDLKSESTRTYKVKLSVAGQAPDGNETIESITHELTLTLTVPSGCFIFTAVLGTRAVQDLRYMRLFRDNVLMPTPLGHVFVDVYYLASPPIAEVLGQNEFLRIAARTFFVLPILYFSEAILSPFGPLLLLVAIAMTLSVYRKGKIMTFLFVLGQGILIAGSMMSLVLFLGITAHTSPVCATLAAILLPMVLPLASAPFARKLFRKTREQFGKKTISSLQVEVRNS